MKSRTGTDPWAVTSDRLAPNEHGSFQESEPFTGLRVRDRSESRLEQEPDTLALPGEEPGTHLDPDVLEALLGPLLGGA